MVESFLLGGRALRVLALDPLLPEALVPEAERRALVQAMQRYDRAGRRVWAKHMPTHGAADRPSPVDLSRVRDATHVARPAPEPHRARQAHRAQQAQPAHRALQPSQGSLP